MKRIEVMGLQTIPEIKQGDNLADIIVRAGNEEIGGIVYLRLTVAGAATAKQFRQIFSRQIRAFLCSPARPKRLITESVNRISNCSSPNSKIFSKSSSALSS